MSGATNPVQLNIGADPTAVISAVRQHVRWLPRSVLDMPEMQAIRTYLAVEFYHKRPGASAQMMRDEGLPDCVVDWVLS